jgi:hypothetical protein
MLLGEVLLCLLDQFVLVLGDDRFATGAVQVGLHIFTLA